MILFGWDVAVLVLVDGGKKDKNPSEGGCQKSQISDFVRNNFYLFEDVVSGKAL